MQIVSFVSMKVNHMAESSVSVPYQPPKPQHDFHNPSAMDIILGIVIVLGFIVVVISAWKSRHSPEVCHECSNRTEDCVFDPCQKARKVDNDRS